jgi:hypothetical protein
MSSVSDVLSFAALHPDYWTDLLSDSDYPKELTNEEQLGLDAARAHIAEAVVELLHLCASRFFEMLGEKYARKKGFHWNVTAKNRRIDLHAPNGTAEKLYRLEFLLWGDASEGQPVALWSSLIAKKKYHQPIGVLLAKAKVQYEITDYHITASPAISLREGTAFAEIADQAASQMLALVNATYKAKLR